jgi:hypothetical protein
MKVQTRIGIRIPSVAGESPSNSLGDVDSVVGLYRRTTELGVRYRLANVGAVVPIVHPLVAIACKAVIPCEARIFNDLMARASTRPNVTSNPR